MRKTISIMMMALLGITFAKAQIANGFYHIQNEYSGRYISISDNNPSNYSINVQAGTVNTTGIRTYLDYDRVVTSPSCVLYIKSAGGNQYDIMGQGTSLYAITGNRYINLTPSGSGYVASGSAAGFTLTLSDLTNLSYKEGWLNNNSSLTRVWKIKPINTTDEYVAIQPTVKTDDGYWWGTIYAGFSFKLASSGMKAYYVTEAGYEGFKLREVTTEVIPDSTPVIVRCSSGEPVNCKIEPVSGAFTHPTDNILDGVFCCIMIQKNRNAKPYNPASMRVIGVSNGKLAFVKAPDDYLFDHNYLPANRAYLPVFTTASDVMLEGGNMNAGTGIETVQAEEETKEGIYSLTGVRLPDGVTPSAGIYIKNGKKVVIK